MASWQPPAEGCRVSHALAHNPLEVRRQTWLLVQCRKRSTRHLSWTLLDVTMGYRHCADTALKETYRRIHSPSEGALQHKRALPAMPTEEANEDKKNYRSPNHG